MLIQTIVVLSISYYFITTHYNTYKVNYHVNLLTTTSYKGEFYYADKPNIYNEQHKKRIQYKPLQNKSQKISFTIKNDKIKYIRLDPLLDKGIVQIEDLSVTYKNQTYQIDLTNIQSIHNLNILERSNTKLKLSCIGKDPYLIFNEKINFNEFNFINFITTLFFTILLSIFISIFLHFIKKYTFENILLGLILLIYSIYVILFSTWTLGNNLLILFFSISIVVSIKQLNKEKINYLKQILFFLFIYFSMSYSSILLSSNYANLNYLYTKTIPIILAIFIPFSFYHIKKFDFKFFKFLLTTLLIISSICIILLNSNIISINQVEILGFIMERSVWTQKNYIFWYLLLLFGTLSFYIFTKKRDFIFILGLISIAYFSIFNAYSDSAKVAFTVGISIYFFLSIFSIKKNILLILIWIMTLYIIFSPILFSYIDLSQYHSKLIYRNYLYHISATLIKEHWIFGYGYGSTLSISFSDILNIGKLDLPYGDVFKGGHPHNLSLLFWLEFGIFGAIFLAYFIHKLLENLVHTSYGKINHAALFGMVFAFEIITSFSWDIWYPQVLLTYAFFGVMISLILNIRILSKDVS